MNMQIIFKHNWNMQLRSQERAFGEIPVDKTVRDKVEERFFYAVWVPSFYLPSLAYING